MQEQLKVMMLEDTVTDAELVLHELQGRGPISRLARIGVKPALTPSARHGYTANHLLS